MMFRIIWSVHAFTLRSSLHERNMPAMKWGLKVLWPVPALWSQQGCPWNKSLLLCDLGFQFCILSFVSFFFLLFFCCAPTPTLSASSVLSQDATFCSCSGAWGNQRGGIDSLLSTLLRCRLNYPMKNVVLSSSDSMCVVVLTLMVFVPCHQASPPMR